jgi:glyoxylase-like metal-dependent hydrolase (beta-lactamase superfamily II)
VIETEAAPGIHRVEDAFTNFYLVESGDRVVIFDAALPPSWNLLVEAVSKIGRSLDQVEAVVLTHAHFDHVGFAERARKELGVPVWVHENDEPLTRKPLQYSHENARSRYLLNPKAMPIVAALTWRRAFFPPPVKEVKRYDDAGRIEVSLDFKVIPTPGHTIGHCSFHLPDRDAVIVGDALVTLNPYTGSKGPQIVSGAATADSKRNLSSLDGLAETGAKTLLTGHGETWTAGAEAAVAEARRCGPS